MSLGAAKERLVLPNLLKLYTTWRWSFAGLNTGMNVSSSRLHSRTQQLGFCQSSGGRTFAYMKKQLTFSLADPLTVCALHA